MRTARIALAIALALLVTAPTVAQEKKKKARGGKLSPVAQAMMRMQKLHNVLEDLDLTDEQKEEHKKLHEANGPKLKELMEKLGKIVTEEQTAAAKAAAEKAKEAGKEGRAFFAAVEASITLTDEQKKEVNKVGEELLIQQREMVKAVRKMLTDEQKEKLTAAMAPAKKKSAGEKKKSE